MRVHKFAVRKSNKIDVYPDIAFSEPISNQFPPFNTAAEICETQFFLEIQDVLQIFSTAREAE